MTYPNAFKGVKKIFTAEILTIISTILLLIAAALAVGAANVADTADETALAMIGVLAIFGIAGTIIALIAFFINLSGLKAGAQDEPKFKTALIFVIVGIVATLISGFFEGVVSDIFSYINSIASVLITYFVISAIMSLAGQLGNEEMVQKGKTAITFVVAAFAVSLIVSIISLFLNNDTVVGVLGVIALILSLVQYIIYLVYLAKSKKMLSAPAEVSFP